MMRRFLLIITILSLCAQSLFAQSDNLWTIKTEVIPDAPYYGVTTANGVLGIVSSATPLKVEKTILSGLYDIYGRGDVINFLEGFDILNLSITVDDKPLDKSLITNHYQTLQMHQGELHGEFHYGQQAIIRYKYCALRHLPHSAMLRVEVEARQAIKIECQTTFELPKGFKNLESSYQNVGEIGLLWATADTPTARHKLGATTSFLFDQTTPKLRLIGDSICLFDHKIKRNERFSFAVVGSMISTATHSDVRSQSQRLNLFACLDGEKKLIENHHKEWSQLWHSDIEIMGDDDSQRDIRSMIYHLYSFVREGSSISISPMGLSGTGYNGHIFWDAEIWIFPALLILQPEMARSMVDYRIDRLNDAIKNARSNGYRGAQYPWESADDGLEHTPVFALTGPFEHHITACVAIAAWDYFRVSGDTAWLRDRAGKMIEQCANFWLSRVQRNEDGMYEICNVVGADEYAENIDNDAFTNAAAKLNLEIATKAAKITGQNVDTMWQHVADRLIIETMADGTTREHKTYQGEIIKQADVNLLAYPLRVINDKDQILKDLQYYQNKIAAETPAMTHSIFSILYSTIGDTKRATANFKESYYPNRLPPFGVLAETRGGVNPYFATGAGGTLQAVMMGFGGLQITDSGVIETGQKLPNEWKKLIIKR